MLFNTYTFGVFLIFVFGVYLCLPLRGRQIFLLAASYVFYCWEKPVYGLLLLTSTCLDFTCGLCMGRFEKPSLRRVFLVLSILGNLSLLGFFKYADFVGANIAGLGHLLGFNTHWTYLKFALPVGISFYTFQTMSYSIQVYRRQIEPSRDPIAFALFVSFFPQLVAGPIERATNLLPQLNVYHRINWQDVEVGVSRIIIGLFRKLVIADRLGILVDMVYRNPDAYSTATAWIVMPSFALQIYLDFAGYADIAIGTARLFGIRLTENFRRPMLARSIGDFWNRWHITLTSWLRDYVFYPLGGFRKGGPRAILNGWIVLLLCGLWHGARWNFVLWGAYQSTLVTLYYTWRFVSRKMGLRRSVDHGRLSPLVIASILLTFACSSINTLFFRAPNLAAIGHMLRALTGRHAGAGLETPWYPWAYLGIVAALLTYEFCQEYLGLGDCLRRVHWSVRTTWMTATAVATYIFAVNTATPYIYFQF